MNPSKSIFNKIIIITLCIGTIVSLRASEHYNASADAYTRRALIDAAFKLTNNTPDNVEDLTLRKAVLDKNHTLVQTLLATYNRDVMCPKIIDDARASLDETYLYSAIKRPACNIATGAAITTGLALTLYNSLHNENVCAIALTSLGVSFYMFGDGIYHLPSALQGYYEFCKKYPEEQQRNTAITCAQKIKELINNYKSQQK